MGNKNSLLLCILGSSITKFLEIKVTLCSQKICITSHHYILLFSEVLLVHPIKGGFIGSFCCYPDKTPFLHLAQSFNWSPTLGLTCSSFLSLHFYTLHGRLTSPVTHVSHFLQNSTKDMTLLGSLLRLKQLIDSFIHTVQ